MTFLFFLQPPHRFNQTVMSILVTKPKATVPPQMLRIRFNSKIMFSSTTDLHSHQVTVIASTTQSTQTQPSTKTYCTSSTWPKWATAWEREATDLSGATIATPPTPWPSLACMTSIKKGTSVLVRMATRLQDQAVRRESDCVWIATPATAMLWQSTQLLKVW